MYSSGRIEKISCHLPHVMSQKGTYKEGSLFWGMLILS